MRTPMLLLLLLAMAAAPHAQPNTTGFPRYASLKRAEVNVRSGPGNQYPILWVYQRIGYPVQLLARFENYYKIRDFEGEEGWVYTGLVSNTRTSLVISQQPVPLYRRLDSTSSIVARLSPGVVVELLECRQEKSLCRVEVEGIKGWVNQTALTWAETTTGSRS